MKIICMDCHTESSIEVELLKDKKRLVCENCAENLRSGSVNQAEENIYFPEVEAFDFPEVAASEPQPEKGISIFGEDEVLEIPFQPETDQAQMVDEPILASLYDSNGPASEEASSVVAIEDNPVKAEPPVMESPRHYFSTVETNPEASTPTPAPSHLSWPVEEPASEPQVMPSPVKTMTVKTSMLIGVSLAFVLFIALGDKIIRSASKPSPQTAASSPVIPPKPDIQAAPAPAASKQSETAKPALPEPPAPTPTPAPQVSETKPANAEPAANQPPVPTATEGQFTIQVGSHNNEGQANEQAEKLRAAGFEPRIVSVDIPKRGRWYRVQSGSFSNRAEANRYGSQIMAKGAAGTFVVSGL